MEIKQLLLGLSACLMVGSATACYDSFVGTDQEQSFSKASNSTVSRPQSAETTASATNTMPKIQETDKRSSTTYSSSTK
jgi:hypothetical protein